MFVAASFLIYVSINLLACDRCHRTLYRLAPSDTSNRVSYLLLLITEIQ
jgi:hypothetical protein